MIPTISKTLAELVPGDRLTSRLGGPVQTVTSVIPAPGYDRPPDGRWSPTDRLEVRTDAGGWTGYADDLVTVASGGEG
jgi:hypothetical protein